MKQIYFSLFIVFIFFTNNYFSQSSWTTYNSTVLESNVLKIDAQNKKWIGNNYNLYSTLNGVNWSYFGTNNSQITPGAITSIVFDQQGFKWFGTTGGVSRFDGINWKSYTKSNSAIVSNSVSSIVIDSKGNKWIGTYDGGLSKFNGTDWTNYTVTNTKNKLLTNAIICLAIDTLDNIWIGTNNGLCKFDGDTTWTSYKASSNKLSDNYIYSIAIDKQNNKWIGTRKSLNKMNENNWTTYLSVQPLQNDSRGLLVYIDKNNNKWIGTSGAGLFKFDDLNWKIYCKSNSGIIDNTITSIDEDNSGNYWIGTMNGISKLTKTSSDKLCVLGFENYFTAKLIKKCKGYSSVELNSRLKDSNYIYKWTNSNGVQLNGTNVDSINISIKGSYSLYTEDSVCYQKKENYVDISDTIPQKPTAISLIKKINKFCSNSNVILYNPYPKTNKFNWIILNNTDTLRLSIDSLVVLKSQFVDYEVSDNVCFTKYGRYREYVEVFDTISSPPNKLPLIKKINKFCSNSNVILYNPYPKTNKFNWIILNNTDTLRLSIDSLVVLKSQFVDYEVSDNVCFTKYGRYREYVEVLDTILSPPNKLPLINKNNRFCRNSNVIVYNPFPKSCEINWIGGNNKDSIVLTQTSDLQITVSDSICKNQFSTFNYHIDVIDSILVSEPICMVTNNANHNLIIWDNIDNNLVSKFRIYKQNHSTSNYDLVHEQSKNILSQWLDTLSTNQIERYKLSILDSCGNESGLSGNHTTILLSSNLGSNGTVNLNWNAYEGFGYSNFEIWRSADGINFSLLSTVANNTYSYIDNNPPTKGYYQIRISKSSSCTPTLKSYNSICSNIVNKTGGVLGMKYVEVNEVNIYPNPTNNSIDIKNLKQGSSITISDINGRVIYTNSITSESLHISLSEVASKGIYFLNFLENDKVLNIKKLILE